jgi:nicotinamidase-related amidase
MASSALLLIDCQDDFLARPGLVPDRVTLTDRAAHLLARWRALGLPVAHVHTVTEVDGDDRMPHWRQAGLRVCVAGSAGAAPPPALVPLAGELVARKRFYNGFADPALDAWLRERGIARLVLAGL